MRDLFFLTCGGFVPPALAIRPLAKTALKPVFLSNTVAVVVQDGGDIVLVDAGWDAATCEAPVREMGLVRVLATAVRVRREDAITSQLVTLGLDPKRVVAIVATHLHLDHVGGVSDFPNAEVIVSESELAAYRRVPRHPAYRARDLARAGRIRTVALEGTPTYGFPGSADPFGQGEVVMLDARGHSAGNVAVALRGPTGTFVHVGDAVHQSWEFGLSREGPSLASRLFAWRSDELKRTYECLRACEVDPRRPVLVPSHDAGVFARLPHAPRAVPSAVA
jgi:glyoxylase-like metal-dependent hydrolase (beta-lactamase superfamily II)